MYDIHVIFSIDTFNFQDILKDIKRRLRMGIIREDISIKTGIGILTLSAMTHLHITCMQYSHLISHLHVIETLHQRFLETKQTVEAVFLVNSFRRVFSKIDISFSIRSRLFVQNSITVVLLLPFMTTTDCYEYSYVINRMMLCYF